jgi:hypothetical protein
MNILDKSIFLTLLWRVVVGLADIKNTKKLVERRRKAGQLSWFCKRTTTLQSGIKNKRSTMITNYTKLKRKGNILKMP